MGVKTRREMRAQALEYLQRFTHMMRREVVHMNVSSESQLKEMKRRQKKKFLVCGKIVSGNMLWDVYQLCGLSQPKLVAGDFFWQEEAISFARDRSLGRQAVSFNGVRCVLGSGRGGVMSPDRKIETPGAKVVPIKQTKSGVVVG